MTDSQERLYLAKLSLEASEKALKGNAYSRAANLLESGIDYLPTDAWQTNQNLAYALHQKLVQSYFLNGDYQKADECSAFILSQNITIEQQVEIYTSNVWQFGTG